jgi:hypothetical protein
MQQAVGKTSDFLYDLIRMETMQGYRQENLADQRQFQEQQAVKQREHRVKESGEWQPVAKGDTPQITVGGQGYTRTPITAGPVMSGGKAVPGVIGMYQGKQLKSMTNLPKLKEAGYTLEEVKNTKNGKDVIETYLMSPDGTKSILVGTAGRWNPSGGVNVTVKNMGAKAQNTLEDRIINADDVLQYTARVGNLYKPEYLQYMGKGQAKLENTLSKLGIGEAEFAKGRAAWALEVDKQALIWRKFITGVAGGPVEMKMIEKTTLNTKYDSPAQHEAKMKYMPVLAKEAKKRAEYLLRKGFKNPNMAPPELKAEAAKKFPFPEVKIPGDESELSPAAKKYLNDN